MRELTNEMKLASRYRKYSTTPMIDSDIRFIRKINTALNKHERTLKPMYLLETKNILTAINNTINTREGTEEILYYIEDKFKIMVRQYIEEL
jgi:hypothetical protein